MQIKFASSVMNALYPTAEQVNQPNKPFVCRDAHAGDDMPAPLSLDADISPEEMQMMQAMGIPFGFDTTQVP